MTSRNSSKLPNFFIVGAAKSGTTSLFEAVALHPDVYMSPLKEPDYFSSDLEFYPGTDPQEYRVRDAAEYLSLFDGATTESAIGEASTSYLFSPSAPARIRSEIPHAKIIVALRNPIECSASWYLHLAQRGYVHRSFSEELADDAPGKLRPWGGPGMYIDTWLYSVQLRRYFELFPKEQILILFAEDVWKNPTDSLKRVFRFLGVADALPVAMGRFNAGVMPRSVRLNYLLQQAGLRRVIADYTPEPIKAWGKELFYRSDKYTPSARERAFLKEAFSDDIQELQKLLDRDLSHWLA
jgi:hypothetical protein